MTASGLAFAGPDGGRPVTLEVCRGTAAVTDHIGRIIAGWPGVAVPGPGAPVAGRLDAAPPGRWQLHSEALEGGVAQFDNALAAANATVGILIAGLLQPRPDWVCLHAAALDISDPEADAGPGAEAGAGSGVLLVGDHLAGKSLFAATAAAAGARLVTDDRAVLHLVPDAPPELVALGVQPKLREPLPRGLPLATIDFICARRGAAEGEMRFLGLTGGDGAGDLLPFGTRIALKRLIFLERSGEHGVPARAALGAAAAVARLIPFVYAPGRDAEGRVQAARRLVGAGGASVLRYRDCWDALDLLQGPATAEGNGC